MKIHEFYRKFEQVPRDERFQPIELQAKPTSLFVIYKMLGSVRAQKRHYEELEEHLLEQAEQGFNQRDNG